MTNDPLARMLADISARLTLHAFSLEILFANWLATADEETADAFLRDFKSRQRVATLPEGVEADDVALHIANLSRIAGERFADRVRDRCLSIRKQAGLA